MAKMNRIQVGQYWYDRNDLLGSGAFGEVYKGHSDQDKNLQVAIKRIDKVKLPSKFIEREIQILKDLSRSGVQSMNLVTLLDYSQTDKYVYLIMEYCNGGDLDHYLKQKGRMDEPSLKVLLQQMASGLKILHDHKVIHRDLKPANIIISYNGTPDIGHATFKIADFGMGRFLNEGSSAETYCGTREFMAPEISNPNAKYDYKVDLWSLGAIVYNCFTGKIHLKQEEIRFPSNTSSNLKDLVTKLLCNDPNSRLSFDAFYFHPFIGMGGAGGAGGASKRVDQREAPGPRRKFFIVSKMNGKVLDISGGDPSPGASVIVWPKNSPPTKNQLWYFDSNGIIHSALNDLVPESRGGGQVKMAHLSGDCSQQWTVECNKIVSKTGECLDIRRSNHANGAEVISYAYYNTSNQHWRLEYV